MWKIILLCSLLSFIQANKRETVYGTWTQIAFYPAAAYVPVCIQYVFENDPSNSNCSCTDGKTVTLMQVSLLLKEGNMTAKVPGETGPMTVVDTLGEAASDVKCTCGEKVHTSRLIVRIVNPNYFVFFEKSTHKQYTEAEPNNAYVFAKKVPTTEELIATLESIEELKNRKGALMCASDVNLEE